MESEKNRAARRSRCGPGLVLALALVLFVSAEVAGQARDELDGYLGRLVTEIRASVPDLEEYEPFLVLNVLHDERGYRVRASDLLERRFTTALAAQRVRVIDQAARQRILDELEACYTDEAPFCRASDVVGRFQTAGGIFEGSVLPMRGGTEFRVKLVVATGSGELSPGEILGTWSVLIAPPAIDPLDDLLPVAGAVSYGAFGDEGDSVPAALGELRVDVRTQDGTPAWVTIDGRVNVPAPAVTAIAAGPHLLTITARGHKPFSAEVDVPPRGSVRRQIVLARGVGQIWVRSRAAGATVLLDGKRVGETPWRGKKIETGPHQVRLEREGYQPYEIDFVLEHEEVRDVYADLVELAGDIVITCLQDDIAVFMDDISRGPVGTCSTGRTLTLSDVPAGRHTLWGARGSDRTNRMNVVVRGGRAVPLRLSLRLDLPDDVRDANERNASEQELYEPFGGYGWRNGLYVGAGFVGGQAKFDMSLRGSSDSYRVTGFGARIAADLLVDPWKVDLGLDFVYLDDFAGLEGTRRYHEIFLGLSYYFLPQSSIRPYLGARAGYGGLSLDEGAGGADLVTRSFGGAALGGVVFRLGRSATLELGAAYGINGGGDIKSKDDGDAVVGEIDGWSFLSGFLSASVHVGPGG